MKKIIKLFAVLLFAGLSLISCNHNLTGSINDNKYTTEKAYLSFGINESEGRKVAPSTLTWDEVHSIDLKKDNSVLKTWTAEDGKSAYDKMKADTSVLIDAGKYTFAVELKDADGDILQTGKLENVEIKAGNNPLNFTTKPFLEGKGILSIFCYVDEIDNIDSAKVYLDGELFDSFDGMLFDLENPIKFGPKEVDCGNYILTIEFCDNDDDCIEKTTDFIEIQNKRETVYTYNYYEATDVYPVEFSIDGSYNPVIFTDDVDIKAYTADKSLPPPEKIANKPEGLEFFGWYNEQNISITELPEHADSKVNVYARFGKSITSAAEITDDIYFYHITPKDQDEWSEVLIKIKSDQTKTVSLDLSNVTDLTDTGNYFGPSFRPTLTGIVLPACVETINAGSFSGYDNLEYVEFAKDSKVKCIEMNAFDFCSALREITIPKSVESIGNYAFESCESLKKITFEAGSELTSIGMEAMEYCCSLEDIVIPASVNEIGQSAFISCENLKKVAFETGSEITTIGEAVFSGCSSLEDIVIPSSVTEIGNDAFSDCGKLSDKVFSAHPALTLIGHYAFNNCTSLTNIVIPSTLVSIGELAFSGCTGLATVTFENNSSLTNICMQAFENCTSLTEIEIPQSVENFGSEVFAGCTNLEKFTVPHTAVFNLGEFTSSEDCTFKVIVTDGTETIENSYFYEAKALTEVVIPSSVTTIESSAFLECTNLKTVTFTGESTLESIRNSAFENCTSLTDFVIPSSVTEIAYSAFKSCTSLKSITIPAKVTVIDEEAFMVCTSLASVTFENDSALTEIRDRAFSYCFSLKEIVLPESVTSMGSALFSGCELLENVVIPSKVGVIAPATFTTCTSLKSITIPAKVTVIEAEAFGGCTSLASVTFENGSALSYIYEEAFQNCTSLTEIEIPQSVDFFGSYVFEGCTNLKKFTVPHTVVERLRDFISSEDCTFKVIVTDGTETINDSAFAGAQALTEVVIPSSVTTIGDGAFSDCSSLEKVIYLGDKQSIEFGENVFSGCPKQDY